jgi:hypothetical protein
MCTLGKAIPIVGSLVGIVLKFLTNQTGQLKVQATQFAEAAVPLFYGLEPNCAMPPGGLPVTPGANPPKFCASSVAGMIERCQLAQAQQLLNLIQSKFQQAISSQPQEGPYIARWWNEYGSPGSLQLSAIIQSAQASGTCAYVPPTGGGSYPPIYTPPSTTSYTPYIILGGIGLVGLIFMMK